MNLECMSCDVMQWKNEVTFDFWSVALLSLEIVYAHNFISIHSSLYAFPTLFNRTVLERIVRTPHLKKEKVRKSVCEGERESTNNVWQKYNFIYKERDQSISGLCFSYWSYQV